MRIECFAIPRAGPTSSGRRRPPSKWAIEAQFGGMPDAVEIGFLPETPGELMKDVVSGVQRIPATFERHQEWSELA